MFAPFILSTFAALCLAGGYTAIEHTNHMSIKTVRCGGNLPTVDELVNTYQNAINSACTGGDCIATTKCGTNFCVEVQGAVNAGGQTAMNKMTSEAKTILRHSAKKTSSNVECPSGKNQIPGTEQTVTVPTLFDFARYPTKADKQAQQNRNAYLIVKVTKNQSAKTCKEVANAIAAGISFAPGGGFFGVLSEFCS